MLITRESSGDIVVTSEFPFNFFDIQRLRQKILLEEGVEVGEWPILSDIDEPAFEGYWILTFCDPSDDFYLDHEELV